MQGSKNSFYSEIIHYVERIFGHLTYIVYLFREQTSLSPSFIRDSQLLLLHMDPWALTQLGNYFPEMLHLSSDVSF